MINNWRLECFIAVSQTLNFRQAAESLHVTQPALTKQINALEFDLGVRLLERDTTHVRLTDEGHAFLRRAVSTLQAMRELEGMFRRGPEVVFNYLYQYGLSEVAARFRSKRPGATLNMLRLKMWGDTPSVIKRPGNLVVARQAIVEMQDDGVFVPLGPAREYMLVPHGSPLAERPSIRVGDIDRSLVIIRSGSQLATRDIDEPGIRLEDLLGDRPFVGCNHLDETIEMVKAGCGIAFALMPLDMDSPEVARVPLEPFGVENVGLGYLRRNESPDLRALVEAVAEVHGDQSIRPVFR